MPTTTYALKNIQPNPFRHMERYPIREDKVEALSDSINRTGFWDNIVARNGDGDPEIAYGHHRLEALRRVKGANYKVDLIIKDLSDEDMLKVMADENMEEWTSNAAVTNETVQAVVQAYAEDKIKLDRVPKDTPANARRYAPSFMKMPSAGPAERPYTAQTVANFLGWTKPNGEPQEKVKHSLAALELIEEGILREQDFDGLNLETASNLVRHTRTQRDAERKALADIAARRQKAKAAKEKAEKDKAREEARQQAAKKRAEAATSDAARKRAEIEAQAATQRIKEVERERKEQRDREAALAREEKKRQKELADSAQEEARKAKAGDQATLTRLRRANKPNSTPSDKEKEAARIQARVEEMARAREEREAQERFPDSPEGKAAHKAELLLIKACGTEGPESESSFLKARDLIQKHGLQVTVQLP